MATPKQMLTQLKNLRIQRQNVKDQIDAGFVLLNDLDFQIAQLKEELENEIDK